MSKPFLIVSDVHLGAVPEETEREFRRFLDHVGAAASGLLINGDLFDFWFEYRSVVPRKHYRVLAALTDIVEAGVPITFIGGNHDGWAGDFLSHEVGMTLLDGPVELEMAGRRALVAHGDGVGEGDLGYRILRRVIRHPVTTGAFRLMHPDLGSRLADRVSSTEEKAGGSDHEKSRAASIRRWAEEALRARPQLDLVVAGHAHAPEVVEVESGRWFVNSGDWVCHRSYLELRPDRASPLLSTWA
jgi:UDP-2,3-diacylglucosamine hydrolase